MRWIVATIVLLSVAVAAAEVGAHWHYRDSNQDDRNINQFVIYDEPILHAPDRHWTFVLMDENGVQLRAAPVTNNWGLISHRDYKESPATFNVMVIGGEQTASQTVTVSWPDYLQDELGDEFHVFNVGWPDAGPAHYIEYWEEWSERIQPDLVIVNYVWTDFYRGPDGATYHFKLKDQPIKTSGIARYPIADGEAKIHTTLFEGADYEHVARGAPVISDLTDPYTIANRPYGTLISDGLDDEAALRDLQARVVSDVISGAINWYGCMICVYLNGEVQPVHQLRNFDAILVRPGPSTEELIRFGAATLGWMAENVPDVVFFRAASQGVNPSFSDRMQELVPAFQYTDLGKYLDRETHYLGPWLPEKLNDAGMRTYARLVAPLVRKLAAAKPGS